MSCWTLDWPWVEVAMWWAVAEEAESFQLEIGRVGPHLHSNVDTSGETLTLCEPAS